MAEQDDQKDESQSISGPWLVEVLANVTLLVGRAILKLVVADRIKDSRLSSIEVAKHKQSNDGHRGVE